MRKIIILIVGLLIAACSSLYAQEEGQVKIGNVQVSQQEKQITVRYDLSFGVGVRSCKVNLFLSTDGGRTFASKALSSGVSGDTGRITFDGTKTILFDASQMASRLNGKQISFKVEVVSKEVDKSVQHQNDFHQLVTNPIEKSPKKRPEKTGGKVMVAPVVSLSSAMGFGLMAGYMGKVGGYAKFTGNFKPSQFSYECTSQGNIPGGMIWATGNSSVSKMNFSAGALFSVVKPLVLYAGAGYMNKTLLWEDTSKNYVKVTDASFAGVCADAGAIVKFGMVGVVCGICVPANFKSLDVNLGVSLFF